MNIYLNECFLGKNQCQRRSEHYFFSNKKKKTETEMG